MAAPPPPKLPTFEVHSLKAHTGPVHVVRFNTLGRYILSGGADRQIQLWNAQSGGQSIKSYAAHGYEVLALDISPDNSRFSSAGGDKNVFLWDVGTGSVIRRFSGHQGRINDVRFGGAGGEGSVLVAAGFDATVRFYDVRAQGAWKPIMELKEAKDAVMCIAVSKDAVHTGSVDGYARTYDLRMGELRADFVDHPITSLTTSTAGSTLLITSLDSTHRLIDATDGSLLQSFNGHNNTSYRCHSSFAAGEAAVVGGDEDGILWGWDVLTGKKLNAGAGAKSESKSHDKSILWAEGSPAQGANEMVTAGADGFVKIWSTDPSPG